MWLDIFSLGCSPVICGTHRQVANDLFQRQDPRVENLVDQWGNRAVRLIQQEQENRNNCPVLVFSGITANHGCAWLKQKDRLKYLSDPALPPPFQMGGATISRCTLDGFNCIVMENVVHPSAHLMAHHSPPSVQRFRMQYRMAEALRIQPHDESSLRATIDAADRAHAEAFLAAMSQLGVRLDARERVPECFAHHWCTDWTSPTVLAQFISLRERLNDDDVFHKLFG